MASSYWRTVRYYQYSKIIRFPYLNIKSRRSPINDSFFSIKTSYICSFLVLEEINFYELPLAYISYNRELYHHIKKLFIKKQKKNESKQMFHSFLYFFLFLSKSNPKITELLFQKGNRKTLHINSNNNSCNKNSSLN